MPLEKWQLDESKWLPLEKQQLVEAKRLKRSQHYAKEEALVVVVHLAKSWGELSKEKRVTMVMEGFDDHS